MRFVFQQLRAHLLGAAIVGLCAAFALPQSPVVGYAHIGIVNIVIIVACIAAEFVIGTLYSARLVLPILAWQLRGYPPSDFVRRRITRVPFSQALVHGGIWAFGTCVFATLVAPTSPRSAFVYSALNALGGTVTVTIGFISATTALRPLAARAMEGSQPQSHRLNLVERILIPWILFTGAPTAAVLLVAIGQVFNVFEVPADRILRTIILGAIATIVVGGLGMYRVARAVNQPLEEILQSMRRLQDGEYHAPVPVYDTAGIGRLQSGFNHMVAGLAERQSLRNMFGRYVGEDVARRALEDGIELGGTEKPVAVLMVDLVGSTRLAIEKRPAEVVELLNEFFRIVVEVVDANGGFVNKFLGDAALVVFNAPIDLEDYSSKALKAARELRSRIDTELGAVEVGIGVSAGSAVAGHIGAQARFEYTVIGDAVNEASRLCELAKHSGGVLASSTAVDLASRAEQTQWTNGVAVELRGRGRITQTAAPVI